MQRSYYGHWPLLFQTIFTFNHKQNSYEHRLQCGTHEANQNSSSLSAHGLKVTQKSVNACSMSNIQWFRLVWISVRTVWIFIRTFIPISESLMLNIQTGLSGLNVRHQTFLCDVEPSSQLRRRKRKWGHFSVWMLIVLHFIAIKVNLDIWCLNFSASKKGI